MRSLLKISSVISGLILLSSANVVTANELPEGEAKEEQDEQEEKTEESKASEDIVDEAIDRGEEDTEVVPASTNASETSTYEKYKNAFSVEQFDIKY